MDGLNRSSADSVLLRQSKERHASLFEPSPDVQDFPGCESGSVASLTPRSRHPSVLTRVSNVLQVRLPFEVRPLVLGLATVLVVHLVACRTRSKESPGDQDVDVLRGRTTVSAEHDGHVPLSVGSWLQDPTYEGALSRPVSTNASLRTDAVPAFPPNHRTPALAHRQTHASAIG